MCGDVGSDCSWYAMFIGWSVSFVAFGLLNSVLCCVVALLGTYSRAFDRPYGVMCVVFLCEVAWHIESCISFVVDEWECVSVVAECLIWLWQNVVFWLLHVQLLRVGRGFLVWGWCIGCVKKS